MTEEWRAIAGFEGSYEVSDQGRVRGLDRRVIRSNGSPLRVRGRVLECPMDDHGYRRATLSRAGESRQIRVHQLVARAFVAGEGDGLEVLHGNGDKLDLSPTNLRWGTRSENQLDAVRHGVHNMASKKKCPEGHEYTPENTRVNRSGSRVCVTCIAKWRAHQRVKSGERGLALEDPRHGTLRGHQDFACRCEKCREAYRAYRREYRARKNLVTQHD